MKTKLESRGKMVFSGSEYLFTVAMTERHSILIHNGEWDKEHESWLDYWKRTEPDRAIEESKRIKLAQDLATAYNEKYELE